MGCTGLKGGELQSDAKRKGMAGGLKEPSAFFLPGKLFDCRVNDSLHLWLIFCLWLAI